MKAAPLTIAGVEFASRLFVGTGKFSSAQTMRASLAASGTQMVTVVHRRQYGDARGTARRHCAAFPG